MPIYSNGFKDSLIIIPFLTKQYQGFGSLVIKSEDEFPFGIIAELTNLYGVGEWTAQMFLIFALKRIDVFALNDAGLLKGIRHTYFHGELVGLDRIQDVVNTWKPYRTIGAWYMWQVANSISH